jgi:anti-sigma28 factor (negative regulator of flagellin synthesis)
MALSLKTKNEIFHLLIDTIKNKLKNYQPESIHMPFHHRLLGKDRYTLFSFIQSINTTFGVSIWEQVAVILAKGSGYYAERQYQLLGEIDAKTENLINKIHYKLRKGELIANKYREIQQIKQTIKKGNLKKDPDSIVDLYVKINEQENFFDITSAKPNIKEFVSLKMKLLRWTLKGLFDIKKEILIGEEFWNFIAGDNIYNELLDIFQKAGEELREEIDKTFQSFRS